MKSSSVPSRQSRILVHFIQNEAQGSSLDRLLLQRGIVSFSDEPVRPRAVVHLFCLKTTVAAQVVVFLNERKLHNPSKFADIKRIP